MIALGRRLRKEEMMRFQGMLPTRFKLDVSLLELGNKIGNSMSQNVIEGILRSLLPAAGLGENKHEDRWKTGKGLQQLRESRNLTF